MGSKTNSNRNIANNNLRVVVADDFQPMLDAIVGLLAPHFDVVGTATDGGNASVLINSLKPDVAVLDVSMPHKTGIEIAADLRIKAPEVKVVIISGHDDESFIRAAREAGAIAYVVKTRMADGLVPAVESALAGEVLI